MGGGSRSTLCDPLVVVKVPTTALLKDPRQFNFIISVFKCKDDEIVGQDDERGGGGVVWGWAVGCHYLGDA